MFPETILLNRRAYQTLGLIVSELVTNAVKHAFSESVEGAITIELEEVAKRPPAPACVYCSVQDNGGGLGVQVAGSRDGLHFVERLAGSLGGACRRESNAVGTRITVEIPKVRSFDARA